MDKQASVNSQGKGSLYFNEFRFLNLKTIGEKKKNLRSRENHDGQGMLKADPEDVGNTRRSKLKK